ncbi:glycosyl transferase [Mucilaginibacter hurinus]|uniref:Peptide O-xylosyltransferase n=1 Tax=Mucilaginibacter hurinus TaxID=2201324 RepID=A0A367GPK4_9SPHI|nr:beta-1,6-N-acetylglucosaminyltransferase [Mucilaginibacter hurinus]RCH54571.1 glycosyl transferase [Mucilaginibacter hurinus]
MRFALLIITYTSARQTKRMIDKLDNGNFDFYIHLDKKVDIDTHKILFDKANVFFMKNRLDIKWGGSNTMKAAFNGIREIVASGKEYAFINLLSGQDYPIKSASFIQDFLSANVGKQFIKYWSFKGEWEEAFERINKYHLTDFSFKGKYTVQKLINRLVKRPGPPVDLKFYGTNSTFWSLSPDCAMYVVDYVDKNRKLQKFFKYSWGNDEFIMQTIIMNSHYKDAAVNNNYRYVDWSEGGARPKFLTVADYDKLAASNCLFARKFSVDVDEQILDMIDEANKKQLDGLHY